MHHFQTSGYRQLVRRINRFPQGAPPSQSLYQLLEQLFSEKEARLVSRLPIKAFTAEQAGRAWRLDAASTRKELRSLCKRALLVDIAQNGDYLYCLPPPMAGFLEFSMMRVRGDLDQKKLAGLLYRYINMEEDFAKALFAGGSVQLGRVFFDEKQVQPAGGLDVLEYDRAYEVIRAARPLAVSLCYCRHKMSYLNKACQAPMEICLTLNMAADFLLRHNHARKIDAARAIDLLDQAKAHNLVQFGENVRQQINFICNCCPCCCEAMIAARKFSMHRPVKTSPFLAEVDRSKCTGCGLCVSACPVAAINLQRLHHDGGANYRSARIDADTCLGCGVCAGICPSDAIKLQPRIERTVTPLNTAHRVVCMAIERKKLQHIIFDNQILYSHRALATFLSVFVNLAPMYQKLAARLLNSRYLEGLIEKLRWQPQWHGGGRLSRKT